MMNQDRLIEISTGLKEASDWVQGQRKTILIGYSEELAVAGGVGAATLDAPAEESIVVTDEPVKKITNKS